MHNRNVLSSSKRALPLGRPRTNNSSLLPEQTSPAPRHVQWCVALPCPPLLESVVALSALRMTFVGVSAKRHQPKADFCGFHVAHETARLCFGKCVWLILWRAGLSECTMRAEAVFQVQRSNCSCLQRGSISQMSRDFCLLFPAESGIILCIADYEIDGGVVGLSAISKPRSAHYEFAVQISDVLDSVDSSGKRRKCAL